MPPLPPISTDNAANNYRGQSAATRQSQPGVNRSTNVLRRHGEDAIRTGNVEGSLPIYTSTGRTPGVETTATSTEPTPGPSSGSRSGEASNLGSRSRADPVEGGIPIRGTAGPSRRRREVAEEDDDIVYAGSRNVSPLQHAGGGARAGRQRPRNNPAPEPAQGDNNIRRLHAALIAARNNRQNQPERRLVSSPSPPPDLAPEQSNPERRIRFGGAVFQFGSARRQYLPARSPSPPSPASLFGDISGVPMNVRNLLLMPLGLGLGGPGGLAAMAFDNREGLVETILKQVEPPKYDEPHVGYVRNFDMEGNGTIVVDDEGDIVRPTHQPHLVCSRCSDILLVSEAYGTPADRVFALRCGHLIDQKCLDLLCKPSSPHEHAHVNTHPSILDEIDHPASKKRKTKGPKKQKKTPDEYRWQCPVEGCGHEHLSQELDGTWTNTETEGAIAVFA